MPNIHIWNKLLVWNFTGKKLKQQEIFKEFIQIIYNKFEISLEKSSKFIFTSYVCKFCTKN